MRRGAAPRNLALLSAMLFGYAFLYVPLITVIQPLRLEMLAERRFDFLARQPLFDKVALGPAMIDERGCGNRRSGDIFLIDLGDAPPKVSQLLLKIAHSPCLRLL